MQARAIEAGPGIAGAPVISAEPGIEGDQATSAEHRTGPVARTVLVTAVLQARPAAVDIMAARVAGVAVTHVPAAAVECRAWEVHEAVGAVAECHAAEVDSAAEAADAGRR